MPPKQVSSPEPPLFVVAQVASPRLWAGSLRGSAAEAPTESRVAGNLWLLEMALSRAAEEGADAVAVCLPGPCSCDLNALCLPHDAMQPRMLTSECCG